MTGYLVLTNADAGSNEDDALSPALEVLRQSAPVEVVHTSSAAELDEVLPGTTDTVVVAGGDGSLHALVNALARLSLDLPVGLIPLGTGNDFARGVGLPLEPAAAARVIAEGEPTSVDLIVAGDGTVVVNNVHVGVGAQAGHEAKALKPILGRIGYVAGALIAGLRPRFIRVSLTVDDERVVGPEQHIVQIAVGNSSTVGGGTELIPGADPLDGCLDVVVSAAVGPVARLGYLVQLRTGHHVERPDVTTYRGKRVRIEGESFTLSADGELSGLLTSASWELAPGALRMHL